jgi:hypothetical protein
MFIEYTSLSFTGIKVRPDRADYQTNNLRLEPHQINTTIEFWYSIPTVFKIGQLQSEYSPGIITVGIQSETFFVVGIQSQYSRIVSGYEASDMKSHSFCVRMKCQITIGTMSFMTS